MCSWDFGHVDKDHAIRKSEDLGLEKAALETCKEARSFYDKLSHATILSMNDLLNIGGSREIYIGPSFDESKADFYRIEIVSRVGFAGVLPNAIEGVARHMKEWPQFRG